MRPAATVLPLAAAVALLTGCSSPAPTSAPTAAPPPAAAAVPTTAPASAAPSAPSASAPAGAVPAGGGSWTMPDLVGTGLQEAQDAIQALTDFAIPLTTSHDATGEDRSQVMDRNWKVCDQSVPPGATITPETAIDFGAVQLDESC